jgi:hypothetical protein
LFRSLTYRFNVTRAMDITRIQLQQLGVREALAFEPSFAPDVYTYQAAIAYDVTSVTVELLRVEQNANVDIADTALRKRDDSSTVSFPGPTGDILVPVRRCGSLHHHAVVGDAAFLSF